MLMRPTQSLYSVLFVTMPLPSHPIQPMTSASVLDPGWCQGCTTLFSQSGLSKHLSQTHKTSCLAFRNLHNAALLVALPSENSGLPPRGVAMDLDSTAFLPPAMADVDMDADLVPFEGDFFGDYPADFFDGPNDCGPKPSDYSSDKEDAHDDGGWELPIASSVHASPSATNLNSATETSAQGPSLPSAE